MARISEIIGRLGSERGMNKENLVFGAFKPGSYKKPHWFVELRKAGKALDGKGIDAVVSTTDCGDLFIQVKSSARGKADFLGKRPRGNIGVIVIRDSDTSEMIRNKVFSEAGRLYATFSRKKDCTRGEIWVT